jgi:hypothetical protein
VAQGIVEPCPGELMMSRPPAFPAEQKVRIVLSILASEITAADAARRRMGGAGTVQFRQRR